MTKVFPTPVGMVRCFSGKGTETRSFPHARGDGPFADSGALVFLVFSPRPWGWSDEYERTKNLLKVFPTPVGMVRKHPLQSSDRGGFPHARGDGPL